MQILITNDDGINSRGIIALADRFKEMGDVLVVAPNKQMSATSHSITTNKPLRYKKHYINNELFGYALEGTPADCVKFAILELLKKQKPDIILSGINHGRNTGINIMYSGTIAGATEGALLNIPSFAVSLSSHDTQADCSAAAELAFQIVSKTMSECIATANIPNTSSLYDEMADLPSNIKQDYQTLPVLNGKEKQNSNTTDSTSYPSKENAQGVSAAVSDTSCIKQEDRPRLFENNVFININVPDVETNKIKGVKVVKSSNSYWEDEFDKRIDPYGNPYYWFNGTYVYDANDTLTDDVAIDEGYVSITPVKLQFNIEALLAPLQALELIGATPEHADEQDLEAFQAVDAEIEKILESRGSVSD